MGNQSLLYFQDTNTPAYSIFKEGNMLQDFAKHTFEKNEFIYLPNQFCSKIFFVESGRVKIGNYSNKGKVIIKTVLFKDDIFGEPALLGIETQQDFAQAMDEEVLVRTIEVSDLKDLMKTNVDLNLFMMKKMSERIISAERKVEAYFFQSSRNRIIDYIYQLALKRGQRIGYEILIRDFLSHREIGEITATGRQTVTTVLNDLRRKNVLTFNRKRFLIRDMEELMAEKKE